MSQRILNFKTPTPISITATACVRTLPRLADNGYSCFEVSIDVFHEKNAMNFPANVTFKTDNPRFTKFANSLTTSSNLYVHGLLYLQPNASKFCAIIYNLQNTIISNAFNFRCCCVDRRERCLLLG